MKGNFNTLDDLLEEVYRVEENKNDFMVNSKQVEMLTDDELLIKNVGSFKIKDIAHGQIASKLNIPKKYYDDMTQIEGLRQYNVNKWLEHNSKQRHFVRTLDTDARAFLSNSYRPIDNYDVLASFLPVIKGMEIEIKSCALTERKLYLQIVFPKLTAELKVGDIVRQGFLLSNSEVAFGAVDMKHFVETLRCLNGAVGESALRKYHIGSRITEDNVDIFKDDTIKAELESFKLRFRDIVSDMLTQKTFMEQCSKMNMAIDDKIIKVSETVQNVTKRFGLSEKLNDLIINDMAENNHITRYGLANGITALVHGESNPDVQYEYEKIGHKIINMTRSEWGVFAAA